MADNDPRDEVSLGYDVSMGYDSPCSMVHEGPGQARGSTSRRSRSIAGTAWLLLVGGIAGGGLAAASPASAAGISPASTATTLTATVASPCALVTKGYLIERLVTSDRILAYKVGDVDLRTCKPTLDTFAANAPTRPFFCSQIAWAADNPGYNLSTRFPLPLKKVLLSVGPAC